MRERADVYVGSEGTFGAQHEGRESSFFVAAGAVACFQELVPDVDDTGLSDEFYICSSFGSLYFFSLAFYKLLEFVIS